MFVRTTEVQADPARIDDGITVIRDEIFPAVAGMEGCVGMSLLADRDSGRCIATTAWESEQAMRASADQVVTMRHNAEESMGGGAGEVHQWEVAVVHREHAAPPSACARLTWVSGARDIVDRAIDTYRMAVLPRVREMDGFCSASLMVDREGGRVVSTVAFDSQEALAASAGDAQDIRERVTAELGARVERIDEMEMAFAHLHVPEMA